jgi:hypothetical protein
LMKGEERIEEDVERGEEVEAVAWLPQRHLFAFVLYFAVIR